MDDDLRDALHSYVIHDEPRLALTSAGAIAAGRRSRRVRWAAGLSGGGLAVALALAGALTVLPIGHSAAGQPKWGPVEAVCATGNPSIEAEARQARITCYLTTAVPRLLPGASFATLHGPALTQPLEAYASADMPDGFDASALVRDAAGIGSLVFSVSPARGGAPTQEACTSKGMCELRTGPHGETIAVYTSRSGSGEDKGYVGYTVYAYERGTLVIAASSNANDKDGESRPTRPQPPLGLDQLIEIATATDLSVFS